MGRPTKYKPEYCKTIIEYFDVPASFETPVEKQNKDGTVETSVKFIPSDLPLLSGFAASIGVCRDTVYEWATGRDKDGELKHPDFSYALKMAKDLQEKLLVTNAMKGLYNSTFAIFTAKNILGWRDKREVESIHSGEVRFNISDLVKKAKDELSKESQDNNQGDSEL